MGLKGEFVLMVNGQLLTYSDYDDIPETFDHVISFKPDLIPGPHTEDEHEELDTWNDKLQRLLEIERASSNKKG